MKSQLGNNKNKALDKGHKREWEDQGIGLGYPELIAAAEAAELFRSLVNPDNSRFYAPDRMSDRIGTFCEETGQPSPSNEAEFVRCILESLALRYRESLEQLEAVSGYSFNALHMVGGGIRNRLLCRLTAEASAARFMPALWKRAPSEICSPSSSRWDAVQIFRTPAVCPPHRFPSRSINPKPILLS